jgi:hypothetical protein
MAVITRIARRGLGVSALFVSILFGFGPSVWSQEPSPPVQQTENVSQRRSPSAFDFLSAKGLQQISTYCANKPGNESDTWLHEKFICDVRVTDVAVAIFTLLLVIVTVPLTLVGWSQARIASRTAKQQLRAYIVVTGKGFHEQAGHDDRFIHKFEIRNTGATPAYKLQIESITRPQPHPIKNRDFDFVIKPTGNNPSVMMLGSGRTVEHDSYAEPLNQAEMIRIKDQASDQRLYTYGAVSYEDAFGRRRYTNFCYFLEWELLSGGWDFKVHPSEHHNDAN